MPYNAIIIKYRKFGNFGKVNKKNIIYRIIYSFSKSNLILWGLW